MVIYLFIYLFIYSFFKVLPIIDAAKLDGAEGCSQVVTDDLLNETFEIRQIQENLLKEVEPLVRKSKVYEWSYVLSSVSEQWLSH